MGTRRHGPVRRAFRAAAGGDDPAEPDGEGQQEGTHQAVLPVQPGHPRAGRPGASIAFPLKGIELIVEMMCVSGLHPAAWPGPLGLLWAVSAGPMRLLLPCSAFCFPSPLPLGASLNLQADDSQGEGGGCLSSEAAGWLQSCCPDPQGSTGEQASFGPARVTASGC